MTIRITFLMDEDIELADINFITDQIIAMNGYDMEIDKVDSATVTSRSSGIPKPKKKSNE